MTESETAAPAATTPTCAQCGRALTPNDRVESGGRLFCRSCYASLRAQLEQYAAALSSDIPYGRAIVGAVLGGAAGALAWWGFTVLTHWALGLLAVGIGLLVGNGTVRFAGGKRSQALQAISVAVALASFLVAIYLVNMTFINQELASQGSAFRIAFPPQRLDLVPRVVAAHFGLMDFLFLAFAIWEAWKIPRPLVIPAAPSA